MKTPPNPATQEPPQQLGGQPAAATFKWRCWDIPERIVATEELRNELGGSLSRLMLIVLRNGSTRLTETRRVQYMLHHTFKMAERYGTTIKSVLVSAPYPGLYRVRDSVSKRLQLMGNQNLGGGLFAATTPRMILWEIQTFFPDADEPAEPKRASAETSVPEFLRKEGHMEHSDIPPGGIPFAIASIPIRQDRDGRYCLNDLHKAAGGLSKDRPSKWLDSETTQELVSELDAEKPASEQNQSLKIHKGGDGWQGTFVARELVYAYAMWISPKFHLAVIRAFDALVMGQQPQVGSARTTTLPGDDRIVIDTLLAAKDRSWQLAIEVRDQMLELVGHDMAKLVGPVIAAYQEKVQNQIVEGVSSRSGNPTAEWPKLAGNWKEVSR